MLKQHIDLLFDAALHLLRRFSELFETAHSVGGRILMNAMLIYLGWDLFTKVLQAAR